MNKHTPGPWIAFPSTIRVHGDARRPIFDDGLWFVKPEWHVERMPIAVVDMGDDHDPPTREYAKYDATLIAAAPEMLEALTRLIIRCDDELADPEDVQDLQWAKSVAKKARGVL